MTIIADGIRGGCQCGAVRFRVAELGRASICHCRMCQKAFGGFFGPLVRARGLEWTRGEPRRFRSSNKASRGFCAACGTPLTIEDENSVEVAIGALDEPELAAPSVQVNPRDKLSFFDHLPDLPGRPEDEVAENEKFLASVQSYQHPDKEMDDWQPQRGTAL
jgi:hypothetical protein